MSASKGKIIIEDMSFYAFHGHYAEEQLTGNRFLLSLEMECDLEKASKSDDLLDALDYQTAYEIVKLEMRKPSHLLEHLAARILDTLAARFGHQMQSATLKLSKLNPPLGGQVEKVSVVMTRNTD